MSSHDLSKRVIFLDPAERVRLATWLSDYDLPRTINPGRAQQLKDAATDYISSKELGILMDELYPLGSAVDVIRGTIEIQVSEV